MDASWTRKGRRCRAAVSSFNRRAACAGPRRWRVGTPPKRRQRHADSSSHRAFLRGMISSSAWKLRTHGDRTAAEVADRARSRAAVEAFAVREQEGQRRWGIWSRWSRLSVRLNTSRTVGFDSIAWREERLVAADEVMQRPRPAYRRMMKTEGQAQRTRPAVSRAKAQAETSSRSHR